MATRRRNRRVTKKTVLVQYIQNYVSVSMDNDSWSWVRRFRNDFHQWQSLNGNHCCTASQVIKKIIIHANLYIILFLTHYVMSWTHKSTKKKSAIAHFTIVTKYGLLWLSIVMSPQLICDITRTRGTGIVTSYSSVILACTNWCKLDLH